MEMFNVHRRDVMNFDNYMDLKKPGFGGPSSAKPFADKNGKRINKDPRLAEYQRTVERDPLFSHPVYDPTYKAVTNDLVYKQAKKKSLNYPDPYTNMGIPVVNVGKAATTQGQIGMMEDSGYSHINFNNFINEDTAVAHVAATSYDDAIQQGEAALAQQNWDEAYAYANDALKFNPADQKAKELQVRALTHPLTPIHNELTTYPDVDTAPMNPYDTQNQVVGEGYSYTSFNEFISEGMFSWLKGKSKREEIEQETEKLEREMKEEEENYKRKREREREDAWKRYNPLADSGIRNDSFGANPMGDETRIPCRNEDKAEDILLDMRIDWDGWDEAPVGNGKSFTKDGDIVAYFDDSVRPHELVILPEAEKMGEGEYERIMHAEDEREEEEEEEEIEDTFYGTSKEEKEEEEEKRKYKKDISKEDTKSIERMLKSFENDFEEEDY